jgi:hypothetical protein
MRLIDRRGPQRREALRRSFEPERVRVLFVGESPPASGAFFYQADSGLYRSVRRAFCVALPTEVDERDFLNWFRRAGCYLVDLCGTPVDRASPLRRAELCRRGQTRLGRALVRLRPPVMVVLLRRIVPYVEEAVRAVGWRGAVVSVPYPGRWKANREAFWEAVVPLIQQWRRSGRLAEGGNPSANDVGKEVET